MRHGMLLMCSLFTVAIASCQHGASNEHKNTKVALGDVDYMHSDSVNVAFQNEYIRVKEFNLKPNEALPTHGGKTRLVYSLNDYMLEWTEDDKVAGKRNWQRGDAHVHKSDTHEVKNIGTDIASYVVFERLATALPTKTAAPKVHRLQKGSDKRLEDANFKLVEIELQPGESQEIHTGSWRAIYALSDYTIEWKENGKTMQKTWKAGDVHWHGPDKHAAKNVGDTTAHWLVVVVKK